MARIVAYIDPGTGSMILQGLLAGAAGVVVLIKLFGRRVLRLVGITRRSGRSAPTEAGPDPDQASVDAVRTTETSSASVGSARHEGASQG